MAPRHAAPPPETLFGPHDDVIIELHCHSTCSDGSLSPREVALRAGARGVELFCLTDHDTLAGFEATRTALPGCRVLRGLELSCRWEGRNVHLLLYNVWAEAGGGEALQSRLDERHHERCERITQIVEKLAGLGIHLDAPALLAKAEGRTPGRPDVARALVRTGVCTSVREAFDRFLKDGGPADVPVEGLSVAEGLDLARAAGAKISLAHPHTLRHPDLTEELLRTHRDLGLEGIEAHYGSYSASQRRTWIRMAAALDLVVTGGSDFHGEIVPHITDPAIDMPDPLAAKLLAWLDAPATGTPARC